MTKNELKSTTHGGGRVLSVILAGTLAMGMTPAVSLTAQSIEPAQAYAVATALASGDAVVSGTYTYTGSEITPTITVTVGGKVVDSSHYTVTYEGPKNATEVINQGNYTATITAKQDDAIISGSTTAAFEVKAAPVTVTIGAIPTQSEAINVAEATELLQNAVSITAPGANGPQTDVKSLYEIAATNVSTPPSNGKQTITYTVTAKADADVSNYQAISNLPSAEVAIAAAPIVETDLSSKMIVQPAKTSANYNGAQQNVDVIVSAPIGTNGASITIPLASPANQNNGYTFVGWVDAQGNDASTAFNQGAPGSYYAKVMLTNYAVDEIKYNGTTTATTPFVISKCPVDTLYYTYNNQPVVNNIIPVDESGFVSTNLNAYYAKNGTQVAADGNFTVTPSADGASVTIAAVNGSNFSGTKSFTVTTSYAIEQDDVIVTADGKVPATGQPKALVYSTNPVNPQIVVKNPNIADKAKPYLVEGEDYELQFIGLEGQEIEPSAIIDAGTYQVQVTAIAGSGYTTASTVDQTPVNYISQDVIVQQYTLTTKNTTVAGFDDLVYTGKAIAQPKNLAVTANVNGKSVSLTIAAAGVKGDVSVAWPEDVIDANDAKDATDVYEMSVAAVTGGNYTTADALGYEFTVAPAGISASDVTVNYGGTKEEPKTSLLLNGTDHTSFDLANNIEVKVGGVKLTNTPTETYQLSIVGQSGTTVSEPKDYEVAVKGVGNYSGTQTATVKVRRDINLASTADCFTWDFKTGEEPEWTGQPVTPGFTIAYNGTTLKEGTDYTVEWKNNTNAGKNTASVVITGTGATWGGTFTKNFTIKGEEAVIESVKVEKATYDGTEQTPEVTFVLKDAAGKVITGVNPVIIPVGTDKYINANTYAIKVAVEGKYMVEPAVVDFVIDPAQLNELNVTPVYPTGSDAYLLNAKNPEIKPTFAVQLGDKTVTLTNKDITVNTNGTINAPGSYSVAIAGVTGGNFAGSTKVVIDVLQDINNLYVAPIADLTYNGKAQTPEFVVLANEPANEADKPAEIPAVNDDAQKTENYTVSWKNNINAGTAQLVLTGKGVYGGTKTVDFTINKADATLEVEDVADATYTGSAIKPEPAATLKSAAGDLAATDFTASYAYKNNVNAGEATVTVVASGAAVNNYNVAAATKTFKITAADIADATYTGETNVEVGKQPKVSLTFNGKTLVAGTDYDVTATPNVSKEGKANLTVTGKGNFQGTKTVEITVGKAPVNPDKPTSTAGWKQNSTGWWYDNGDNSYPTNTWQEINGAWYHFDKSGYMQTGWQSINGAWYYLNKKGQGTEGAMKTGWFNDNGTWYYLNKKGEGTEGKMAIGWKQVAGTWYYFNKSGAMQTGWQKVNGAWYYMAASGAMQTGWINLSGTWYYLNANGDMVANQWKQINGNWFYFYASGAMAANVWVGNYYVDANGYWVR